MGNHTIILFSNSYALRSELNRMQYEIYAAVHFDVSDWSRTAWRIKLDLYRLLVNMQEDSCKLHLLLGNEP